MEDNWTFVTKKPRKPKKQIIQTNPEQKITYRRLQLKDRRPTNDEQKVIDKYLIDNPRNPSSYVCCCCDADFLSNIVGRKIHPCYLCYCCARDEIEIGVEVLIGSDGSIVIQNIPD